MGSRIEASKGFLVGRTEVGELSISAYALVRYLNKLPVTTSGQKGTTLAAALFSSEEKEIPNS